MTPSKLRALAAAIETPGDLAPHELDEAHEDIVHFLLWSAAERELTE